MRVTFSAPCVVVCGLSTRRGVRCFRTTICTSYCANTSSAIKLRNASRFCDANDDIRFACSTFRRSGNVVSGTTFDVLREAFNMFFLIFRRLHCLFLLKARNYCGSCFRGSALFVTTGMHVLSRCVMSLRHWWASVLVGLFGEVLPSVMIVVLFTIVSFICFFPTIARKHVLSRRSSITNVNTNRRTGRCLRHAKRHAH